MEPFAGSPDRQLSVSPDSIIIKNGWIEHLIPKQDKGPWSSQDALFQEPEWWSWTKDQNALTFLRLRILIAASAVAPPTSAVMN
jgi:hypothetical protein